MHGTVPANRPQYDPSVMSLRARLSLALAILVLLLALGGSAGMMLLGRGDDARDRHEHELAKLVDVEQLRGVFRFEAATFRAFLLSGEETQLAAEEAARAEAEQLIGRLRAADLSVAETDQLDQVDQSADHWRLESVEPLIALRRTGDVGLVAAQFADFDSIDLFAAIEVNLGALRATISERAARSEDLADKAREDVTRLAFAFLVVAVALVITVKLAGRRWLTRPILALASDVECLAPGDLDTVITGTGPPEIVALGTEIERMRRRVAAELEATLRSQEGLVQNATVLMSVRARLESAPELMPSGWSVSATLTPATGVVAGDCYDVAWVQQSRLGLVVVDVAGHGAESAVVALRAKELLRAAMRTYLDLGEGLRWVTRQLDGLEPDMFISAFVAILDTGTGSLEYLSAGHPPALLCAPGQVSDLPPTGPIIGPFEATWASGRATLKTGQALLVYTDGLTEVQDDDRNEYGLDRLRALASERFDDAEALVKRCLDETSAFSTGRGQDDITVVAVSRADV